MGMRMIRVRSISNSHVFNGWRTNRTFFMWLNRALAQLLHLFTLMRIRFERLPNGKLGQLSPTYSRWVAIRQRCGNPSHSKWYLYGGRGISVCARWDESFAEFLADMGEAPAGYWLERIDPAGNYEPGNCQWSPAKRRSKPADPQSVRQRALAARLSPAMVYMRLRQSWPLDLALSTRKLKPGQNRRWLMEKLSQK